MAKFARELSGLSAASQSCSAASSICCVVIFGFETTGGFITQLGTWENVRHQCKKGRVQPSMLFFESGLDP